MKKVSEPKSVKSIKLAQETIPVKPLRVTTDVSKVVDILKRISTTNGPSFSR